jgi:excisionase family DNA binding protein
MTAPLTIDEVARETRLSVATIRRFAHSGQLAYHKFGKRILIERQDLDTFIAAHRHEVSA